MAVIRVIALALAIALAMLPAIAGAAQDVTHIGERAEPQSVRFMQLQIANERDGPLTFEQARTETQRFVTPLSPHAPDGALRFWLRFPLESDATETQRVAIYAGNWEHADFFIAYANGSVAEIQRGILDPLRANETPYATFLLHPHERVTVFAHITSIGTLRNPTDYRVSLATLGPFLETSRYRLYLDGIIFGILFGLAMYNVVIFFSTRDPSYFWYPIYLLATATAFAGLEGMTTSHLRQFVFSDHPFVAQLILRTANPCAWAALAMFTRSFLHTKSRLPNWDRALLSSIAVIIVAFIIWLIDPATGLFQVYVWTAVVILFLATALRAYSKGYCSPYFAISMLILTTCVVIGSLYNAGIAVLSFLPPDGFLGYIRNNSIVFVGSALDALIFSLALADQFKRTTQEQQLLLEAQVLERTSDLQHEKDNSDTLLYNILPVTVADELKATGTSVPTRFDDASILFTDFKDFTTISGSMPAARVVAELDQIFGAFDDIVEAHGLEKIKTIGDAYMAACGLPLPAPDHAQRCARAGLAMIAFVEERNRTAAVKWQMRAGIHSGTVVAGVVGKRKFTYDVWGDSVNIAARVEESSEPGRVSVSAYSRELLASGFTCEYRGKIALKGKGEIDIYDIIGETHAPIDAS